MSFQHEFATPLSGRQQFLAVLGMTRSFLPSPRACVRAGAAIAAIAVVALTSRIATVSATPSHLTTAFAWPGVYDLVGTGFPDGQRAAVMSIVKEDTSYTLVSLQGPPGSLVSFKVAGDSAHVVWNLGTDAMFVNLRGAGDSLTGEWATTEFRGAIHGARRR